MQTKQPQYEHTFQKSDGTEVIFRKYAHLTISRNKIKFTSKNYLIIAL